MKKFVKTIAFVTICFLTATMLFGCSNNDIPETVQESVLETMSTTQLTEIKECGYVFTEVPREGNEIEGYREEHKKRIETNTLMREEEIEFLEKNGYFIFTGGGYFKLSYFSEYNGVAKTYSYPIVYKTDKDFEVWAIDKNGELCSITIGTREVYAFNEDDGRIHLKETSACHNEDFYGLIHYTAKEGEEIIDSDVYRVISYEPATGMIKRWEYGELIGQTEVSANSVYVGSSYHDGYLFKDNNDVWSVRVVYEDDRRMLDSKIIAHNVEMVITTRYPMGYEDYHPLFLMADGTLKAYCVYNGEFDAPVDDESHLIDIHHED